jgi:hypothetical protein
MFRTKVVDKFKTHILCSVTLFRKSCRLWDNVEKYRRAEQATDDNMALVHCMIYLKGYKLNDRTRSEYVILIALPLQQRFHERDSVLHCTYIACLVLHILWTTLNVNFQPTCNGSYKSCTRHWVRSLIRFVNDFTEIPSTKWHFAEELLTKHQRYKLFWEAAVKPSKLRQSLH